MEDARLIVALQASQAGQAEVVNVYDEEAGATGPPVARLTQDGTARGS